MENVTCSPVSTTMAKVAIERAKKRAAEGFISSSMRDAYADYLQIPYGDLQRALALHCEREKLTPGARLPVLPLRLGDVRQQHLGHARSLTPDFAELLALVEELLSLRRVIKGAVIG